MAYNLSSLKRGKNIKPPRIVLYGPHGLGKSTFAAGDPALGLNGAPAPVYIQTEEGLGTIDVVHFPLCTVYQDAVEQIGALITEEHDRQTLVIDTADWLEKLIWKEACRIHGKADIEEFGYGKGYVAALDIWSTFLGYLTQLRDEKSMAIVMTAHCQIKRFDSPETEPYDRYSPKLHASASALVQEWADGVFFTNYKTIVTKDDVGFNQKSARGITTGQRVMYTTEKPAYLAKNRYRLPEELPLSWDAFAAGVAASMTPPPVAPAVEVPAAGQPA